jgi:DNA polymerase I-like protein with 3'-5' exonuclease and polymerase domains
MFFDNEPEAFALKKRAILKGPPPISDTGWRPPSYFPNLSDASVIGFDLERKEDDWDHGPGWRRNKASTVGFSVSARDQRGNIGSWYFPIGHAVEPDYNLDRKCCLGWLSSVLRTPRIPKVGANLLYDIGSLTDDGIKVEGELHDVQFAEAILQSDGLVNLDHLGVKYLDEGKETNALYDWCQRAYGGKPNSDQRHNIWRAPPRLVGPYGERDASHPIRIAEKQIPLLMREGLYDVYRLECRLIPLLIKMRYEGISIDVPMAYRLYDELGADIKTKFAELFKLAPVKIESVNSGRDLARIFEHMGMSFPLTKDGNPSFRKDFLTNLDHPVADVINDIRGLEKARGTFVRNYMIEGHTNGKLYPLLHPLRNDEHGTITGRFSGSDPNPQNIPVRTEVGKRIRRAFTHDKGHVAWEKIDYSQIEYRYLAHYAVGPGSDELREKYNRDKKTDYHKLVQEQVQQRTGRLIERRPIKNLNFGLVFGMGEGKLARQNNFEKGEAKTIFSDYHASNPYVKETAKAIAKEAQILGYITTVLGRRIRFNLWEPAWRDYEREAVEGKPTALPLEWAIKRYGSRIKRANTHKAVNYRLQGSGTGDQIKVGMLACYEAGVFDVIGVPRIQVHDELGFSVQDESKAMTEGFVEMRRMMETCLPISVPVFVDSKRATNWGDCD